MSKKFAIVHPDKTVTLKMPNVLFDIFAAAVRRGYVTIKFSDTQTEMRGRSLDAIIFDEYTDDPELIEKLLTNVPDQSTIKSNQGSNHPEKGK